MPHDMDGRHSVYSTSTSSVTQWGPHNSSATSVANGSCCSHPDSRGNRAPERCPIASRTSDQALFGQEVLGDRGGVVLVDVEALVHLDELIGRDLGRDGIDRRLEVGVRRQVL